jgi:Tfp pilus assembly protein PilF
MNPIPFILCLSFSTAFTLAAGNGVGDLIKKGDALDGQLKTAAALAVYLEAEKLEPDNVEILQRLAKSYDESMVDTTSREEQRRLAELGMNYAKRAVAIDPKNAKAQLSMAITYGRLAPYLDSKTKIAYSKLVKEHAEKALAIDPSSDYSHHVLGAWNYELANLNPILKALVKLIYGGLPAASMEQAEAHFLKAVALAPQRVSHHIELGRTYAALKKKDLAREELNKGLALPSREKDDPSTKQRGRDALSNL